MSANEQVLKQRSDRTAHRIKALELFDTLAELSGPEREPRLLALAQSNPELAQEVQRLLDADAAESGLLDHGVEDVAKTVLSELYVGESATGGLHAGAVIGSFTLLRPLGQGGMGEVWLAKRRLAKADGDFVQQVALKLLKRGMDSDALVRRFVQERRILAELNHPHIARFVDGGISADGRLYYAMEFIEGVSMLDYARQHKLNVRACVQLMSEVCDAVAHAQAHLVVHRDLKPSNILIDDHNHPRLLDFGIAKLLDSSEPNQTATEMRAMTPAYAAPEQIIGEPISTATDVYALGVILYQLLTGTLPHQRSGTLVSLADEVRTETIERASVLLRRKPQIASGETNTLDHARNAREIAGDLDTILLMALRREPMRRYVNAAALGSDLRQWLAGKPVSAQPDTRSYRMKSFIRRNRALVGGASAVFLALLVGLSVALWQANNSRQNAAHAELARARAEASEKQALAIKTFLLQYLRAPDRFESTRNPDSMQEWLQRGAQSAEQQLADMPAAQVEVVQAFARSLASYPDNAATLAAIELAEALNDRTHDAMRAIRRLNIRGQLARAYYLQGNFIRTKELAGDWPRICSEASDASNRAQADSLATTQDESSHPGSQRPNISLDADCAFLRINEIQSLEALGRYALALEKTDALIAVMAQREADLNYLIALYLKGLILRSQGRNLDAAQAFIKSAQLSLGILPAHHPGVAANLRDLGITLERLGAYDEAVLLLDQFRKLRSASFGKSHQEYTRAVGLQAFALLRAGRAVDAVELMQNVPEFAAADRQLYWIVRTELALAVGKQSEAELALKQLQESSGAGNRARWEIAAALLAERVHVMQNPSISAAMPQSGQQASAALRTILPLLSYEHYWQQAQALEKERTATSAEFYQLAAYAAPNPELAQMATSMAQKAIANQQRIVLNPLSGRALNAKHERTDAAVQEILKVAEDVSHYCASASKKL